MVLTQQDRFFIPKNIEKLLSVAEVIEVVNIECKSSLNNKFSDFLNWFGWRQTAKIGFLYLWRSCQGVFDEIAKYKLCGGHCSIRAIAKKHDIPYRIIHETNGEEFLANVRVLKPDLIVSYSAPQIIKEPLLSYPKYGIINVHGSLLPDYRGCLPSFWYLYNGEKYAGATVHYMSEKIDDGGILKQEKIDISACKSMFQLMRLTKELGGELMVSTVRMIASGEVTSTLNETDKGRYFTWPTREQGREFIRSGKRLI